MTQNFSHLPPPIIDFVLEEGVMYQYVGNAEDYVCPVCNSELCWYDPMEEWLCPNCNDEGVTVVREGF